MRTHSKLLSRIGQGTFYVESVSLANGKGDEPVENRLYIREIPRCRCVHRFEIN